MDEKNEELVDAQIVEEDSRVWARRGRAWWRGR